MQTLFNDNAPCEREESRIEGMQPEVDAKTVSRIHIGCSKENVAFIGQMSK